MATFGVPERVDRAGRIGLACYFGAWLIAVGIDSLAEDGWPGLIFLGIGVLVTLTLIPMLRDEVRERADERWTRRDTVVTATLALGGLWVLARALFADTDAGRTMLLAAAPVWIVVATVYAVVRRHNVRRES